MVTYTFTNGTAADATEVNQNFTDVKPKVYADNTGGSHTGDYVESDLASITITQDDLGSSGTIVVTAGFRGSFSSGSPSGNFTFRLYVNGSVVKTITITGAFNDNAGSFHYVDSSLDTSAGNVIVKVTGEAADSTGDISYCDGLNVVGYKYTA